jgi:Fe-S-cluster containining protein
MARCSDLFFIYLSMPFPDNVTRLCSRKRFSFGCHPKMACFTECCRELELLLTPYDVLRLSKELKMHSAEFIDRYVVVEDKKGGLPQLYLGMVNDGRGSCPFISSRGCRVYNSRPGACRAYPVGRGTMLDANGQVHEIHVLVREEHCQGFTEPDSHTVSEWFENQGLNDYNNINDAVLSLLQHEQIHQGMTFTQEHKDNFMLALYKLEEFRKIVASAAFQDKYELSPEEHAEILSDDLNLLQFGISWLENLLFTQRHEQQFF